MFLAKSKLASSSVATVQTLAHIEELVGSRKKRKAIMVIDGLDYCIQHNTHL